MKPAPAKSGTAPKARLAAGGKGSVPAPKGPGKPREPRSPRQHDAFLATKGRLPDGATFHLAYDGPMRQWKGTLEAGGLSLTLFAPAVHRLLTDLFVRYQAGGGAVHAEPPAAA